jgi:hypothetical protein
MKECACLAMFARVVTSDCKKYTILMLGIPDMSDLSPAVPLARGRAMMVPPLSILPPRCIVCNAECNPKTDGEIHRVEAPQGTGALVGYAVGGGVGGLIGAAIQAKSTGAPAGGIYIHYCTCPQHRAVQGRSIRLAMIGFLILVAVAILVGWLVWYPVGMAIFAVGMIAVAIRVSRSEKSGGVANLIVLEMSGGIAVIKGAGDMFLASLPSGREEPSGFAGQ